MAEVLRVNQGEAVLFGYGSLLLKSSMERTLGRPYEGTPGICHVRGWRRTWDSLYPNQRYYYLDMGGRTVHPKNILYLNITRAADTMNGLLYVIREEDLVGFDKREAVYDRLDIREQILDVEVSGGPAWAYVGKAPYLLTEHVSAREAAIRKGYIEIVESGLKELGVEFTAVYRSSTDAAPEENIVDDRME